MSYAILDHSNTFVQAIKANNDNDESNTGVKKVYKETYSGVKELKKDLTSKNDLYKFKRELRQIKAQRRAFFRDFKEAAIFFYRGTDRSISFQDFSRDFKKLQSQEFDNEILHLKEKIENEKCILAGDVDLFDWSDLRIKQKGLVKQLKNYNSGRVVKVGGKKIAASEFAHKKSFSMDRCSTLIIRKEKKGRKSILKFRNGCGDRFCPICGHFKSRSIARHMKKDLKDKICSMPRSELLKGRLVHIVLTVKNLSNIDQVEGVKKAWREIQKNKDRVFKSKRNEFAVWSHASWGWWKFEVTQNAETKEWHPHLHILAWVDGWLDPHGFVSVQRSAVLPKRMIWRNGSIIRMCKKSDSRKTGWWYQMQVAWRTACKRVGLRAALNKSSEINGAKVQSLQSVIWFTTKDLDNKIKNIDKYVSQATSEMAKYVSKTADFTLTNNDDDLIDLMSLLHGKQVMAGWGGVTVKDLIDDADGILECEEDDGNPWTEVVYRFDETSGFYKKSAFFEWDDNLFDRFVKDLGSWEHKSELLYCYESFRSLKT